MNDLLTKVRAFDAPIDPLKVSKLVTYLGDTPSIKTLEVVVKYYKDELKKILSKDLLEWMQENDQVTFETEDMKVSIKTYVSAKMLDPDSGFNWLIANEYGDLIKDNLEFPKGELTPEAESVLDELGLSYTKKSGIHPQSLKKIVSDRLVAGEMLPDEDDGIKVGYYDECVVKERG